MTHFDSSHADTIYEIFNSHFVYHTKCLDSPTNTVTEKRLNLTSTDRPCVFAFYMTWEKNHILFNIWNDGTGPSFSVPWLKLSPEILAIYHDAVNKKLPGYWNSSITGEEKDRLLHALQNLYIS